MMDEYVQKLIAAGIPKNQAMIFLMGADMTSRAIGQSPDTVMRWATNNLLKCRTTFQALSKDGLQPELQYSTVRKVTKCGNCPCWRRNPHNPTKIGECLLSPPRMRIDTDPNIRPPLLCPLRQRDLLLTIEETD